MYQPGDLRLNGRLARDGSHQSHHLCFNVSSQWECCHWLFVYAHQFRFLSVEHLCHAPQFDLTQLIMGIILWRPSDALCDFIILILSDSLTKLLTFGSFNVHTNAYATMEIVFGLSIWSIHLVLQRFTTSGVKITQRSWHAKGKAGRTFILGLLSFKRYYKLTVISGDQISRF